MKKYYLWAGQRVEVSAEVYKEYYRMKRREKYLEERDMVHGKMLYSNLDTKEWAGEEMIANPYLDDVCEIVTDNLLKEQLQNCIKALTKEERILINAIYYLEFSERECGKLLGLSQKAINKRKVKLLAKLKKLLLF